MMDRENRTDKLCLHQGDHGIYLLDVCDRAVEAELLGLQEDLREGKGASNLSCYLKLHLVFIADQKLKFC